MKRLKTKYHVFLLPFLLWAVSAQAIEFNFHDHQQSPRDVSNLDLSGAGIHLRVSASDDLTQSSNGLGVGEGNAELDDKGGQQDVMSFHFFDAQKQPLNVLLKKITLKSFEPNVAMDKAEIVSLDGRILALLASDLQFNASATFMGDRHASNAWSLNKDIKVGKGFTINPTQNSGFYVYSLEVEVMDMPVVFSPSPVSLATEGTPYRYEIQFFDEEPASVNFSLLSPPPGMAFDPHTHTINWTPNFNAQGQYDVQLLATDKQGQLSQLRFTLDVANKNRLPLFTSIPVLSGKETQRYHYVLAAMDKDKEPVFFELLQGPESMRLDEKTQTLSWQPGFNDAGQYLVTVGAKDAFDMGIQQFNLVIEDKNRLPFIADISSQSVLENTVFQLAVKGQDPDTDILKYELMHGPVGMHINGVTGVLTWPVDYNQAGKHQVLVQVNDGKKGVASTGFNIQVENVNRLPVILSDGVTAARENRPYHYHIVLNDPDLDGLVVKLQKAPNGMTLNTASNTVSWLPGFDDAGKHSVKLAIGDGLDEVSHSFTVSVLNENRPPKFSKSKSKTLSAKEGEPSSWRLRATDADDDELVYDLLTAPKGLSLNGQTGKLSWRPDFHQAGAHEVQVQVKDIHGGVSHTTVSFQIENTNRPPVLLSKGLGKALENEHYFFQLRGFDPDQDKLSYDLLEGPQGMTLDEHKGHLMWQGDFNSAGKHSVMVRVSDGQQEVSAFWELTIEDVNRAPSFTSKPLLVAQENKPYVSQLSAQDIDDDEVSFQIIHGPKGMTINPDNNALMFTPKYHEAGFYPIELAITDGQGGKAVQAFTLEVNNTNRAPEFISQPLLTTSEGLKFIYQIQAHDPDGDRLTYRLQSGPSGMALHSDGYSLVWRPGISDAGRYDVTLLVSDGAEVGKQHFELLVQDKKRAPRINNTPHVRVLENQLYEFTLAASHPDNRPLSYALVSAPKGMVLDEQKGLIQWQTNFEDGGRHGVEIKVSDNAGQSTVLKYQLMVQEVNRAPKFISKPVILAKMETGYRYSLMATDKDWNPLDFQLLSGPQHMVLDEIDRVLYWPGQYVLSGEHTVRLKVNDGQASDVQEFVLVITEGVNQQGKTSP